MTPSMTRYDTQTGYMQENVIGEGYAETDIIKRLTGKKHKWLTVCYGDTISDMISAVWQEADKVEVCGKSSSNSTAVQRAISPCLLTAFMQMSN